MKKLLPYTIFIFLIAFFLSCEQQNLELKSGEIKILQNDASNFEVLSSLKEYTLEIYKSDKRTKEGRRLVAKQDFAPVTPDYIKAVAAGKRKLGFIVEVYETFVTKTNLIGGKEFQERYDTPYYCSPSSESYWSM
jgi:hypothetical protein